jgi:hypothetical protein
MAFKKYTQCYNHTPGDKPFHIDDLLSFAIGTSASGIIAGIILALTTAPLIGVAVGVAIAFLNTIVAVANEWLFHRLVCLGGVRCAIGVVDETPHNDGLGAFDNDEFFDIRLMPHRLLDKYDGPNTGYNQTPPLPGKTIDPDHKTEANPANDVYLDNFQGQMLLHPSLDLSYDTSHWTIHCEAEGDFWVRMKDYAALLAILVGLLAAGVGAAGYAGGAAGAGIGCAIGGIFGPIGCLIGAIIGAIIGALLAGGIVAAIGAAILYGILQGIYDANPGDVEDANVGDHDLGPISKDDRVIAFGEHVYDGFHEGWHEIHPLMAVMKLGKEADAYLEWDPDFAGTPPGDDNPPGLPASLKGLTVSDVRQGLASEKFRKRCEWLQRLWCDAVREALSPPLVTIQASGPNRWTIHPSVDGCMPKEEPEPPH